MSAQTTRIPRIDVGTPSREFQSQEAGEWEAVEGRFHGFENLPARKGHDFVISPEFTCFGHQWRLDLWPGGYTTSDDGMVGLYLEHRSDESITVQFGFNVKTKNREGKTAFYTSTARYFSLQGTVHNGNADNWGPKNFAKRSELISALIEGSLIIEVRMRQSAPPNLPPLPFIPENPFSKMILNMFLDEESADVLFEAGSEEMMTAEYKRVKSSPTTFNAHRFIVQACWPFFAELCKSGEDLTTIPITNVKPEIFHHLLHYVYGGKVDNADLKANAKDIIDACDIYEVVNLKLEAEAILVASTTITIDNVMELLLYAEGKSCAFLKESVMDFLVKNRDEVVKNVSFDNVPGHLMKDLLTAVDMDDSMRVSTLRKKLHEKGLEIDGSREAMIALLEENS